MHKNSHIHITPCLPPPAVKQNLNYSISALVIGPSGHVAISSVIRWSGLVTPAEELRSEKQPPHKRNTSPAQLCIHPSPHCHCLCIHTPRRKLGSDTGEATGGHGQRWSSMWDGGSVISNCFKAWDGLSTPQEAEVVVQENSMPIKSACKIYYQR